MLGEIGDVFENEIKSGENWNCNEWKLDETYGGTTPLINAFLLQERRKRVTDFKLKLKWLNSLNFN